jgi:hypothetical protein
MWVYSTVVTEERGSISETAGNPEGLALTLSGDLPCIGCGYELRGLSVLGNCPECGTAIRATVLYKVDPHADALRELRHPRLIVPAMMIWVLGGLFGVLLAWVPRIEEIMRALSDGGVPMALPWSPWMVLAPVGVSFLGAVLSFMRLHKDGETCECIPAIVGCLSYVPLIILLYYLYYSLDARSVLPYSGTGADPARLMVRLGIALSLTGVLLGLRPGARLLVARCLALRSGRVGRQTIIATVAVIWVAGVGDGLRWLATGLPSSSGLFVDRMGVGLVLIGSLLMTVAIFSMVVDAWRVVGSIRIPSPGIEDVLGQEESVE